MESVSRFWHKILLILLKYIPYFIALLYFISAILGCFGITLYILPGIIYISPLSGLLILVMSKVFQFCIWHRLPIYYCFCIDILSTIDYKYGILLSNISLIIIYSLISLIFILIGMCLKEKYNAKIRFSKNRTSDNHK